MSSVSDRSTWTVQKFSSFEDMRRAHVREWQKQSGAVRRAAAWELVVEAWEHKKRDPNELRLQRSITSVRKA
jgi:hypothetical protein